MIYLNGEKVVATIFPDKTSQVWKLQVEKIKRNSTVKWVFESEAEFMHVAQLKMLLDSLDVKSELHMPFLPYARQDKPVANDRTFALHTFCELLNTLKFEAVYAIDPHSYVANLIHDFHVIEPWFEISAAFETCGADTLCFPDRGAFDRYSKLKIAPAIFCNKVRNQLTGHIESVTLHNFSSGTKPQKILIVDDICDGGMTFIKVAEALYSAGFPAVHLYTTHGIYSKGLDVLHAAGIRRIFSHEGEWTAGRGLTIGMALLTPYKKDQNENLSNAPL